jgi:hypothetical protein
MAQEFYINKNSTLPLLKLELINDGRTDYNKFYEYIQNSTVTFNMVNLENDVIVIANQEAWVLPKENSADDEYYLCYAWKARDTKKTGKYIGKFTITFGDEIGGGTLIVPIQNELIINIL